MTGYLTADQIRQFISDHHDPRLFEFLGILREAHCHRCGGMMVKEVCVDLQDSTGQLDFDARRCVQCGEMVDPVILLNRLRHPGPEAP